MNKYRIELTAPDGQVRYLTREEVAKNPWRWGDIQKAIAVLDLAAVAEAVEVYNTRGNTDPDHEDVWWMEAESELAVVYALSRMEQNNFGSPVDSWVAAMHNEGRGIAEVRICGPLRFLVERLGKDQWGRDEYEYLLRDGTWSTDLDRSDIVLRDEGTVVRVVYTERAQVEEVFGLGGGELSDKPWEYTSDPPPAEWGWCNASRSPAHGWRDEGFVEHRGRYEHKYHMDGVPEYLEGEYRKVEGDYITVVTGYIHGAETDPPWGYHWVQTQTHSGETTTGRYEDDRTGEVYPAQVLYLGDGWGEVIYKKWEYCADPEDDADTVEWCERPAWEDFEDGALSDIVYCDRDGYPVGPPAEPWGRIVNLGDGPMWRRAGSYAGDCAHPEVWWEQWYYPHRCPNDPRRRVSDCCVDTHVPLEFHQWVWWYGDDSQLEALIAQYPQVRYRPVPGSRPQISVLVTSDAEHDKFKAAVRLCDG